MLNAITVIAQYARDQAVASARDQALHVAKLDRARVSPHRMDHAEDIPGICLESLKNGKLVQDRHSALAR